MLHKCSVLIIFLAGLLLISCGSDAGNRPDPKPSVYFWRTNFALSKEETAFLKQHHVGRIYLRYFDVVLNEENEATPNATITFSSPFPENVEIVPTVFIMENVLHAPHDELAERLVKRILQMNETHSVPNVREVQLDCDWTERSRTACYALFEKVRELLKAHNILLSATIRLHQLRMPPPPVDYGALMVYNTGAANKANGRNPIIDLRDIEPFLPALKKYDLPLCAAYPDFEWRRLFGAKGLKGILYGDEMVDTLVFQPRTPSSYVAISSRHLTTSLAGGNQADLYVAIGDSVLVSRSDQKTIEAVQQALAKHRPSIHEQVIIYPLAKENILRRKSSEYEKIFNP